MANGVLATKVSCCNGNILQVDGWAALRLQEPADLSIETVFLGTDDRRVTIGGGLDRIQPGVGPAGRAGNCDYDEQHCADSLVSNEKLGMARANDFHRLKSKRHAALQIRRETSAMNPGWRAVYGPE
jgi:hypothetical protein